MIRIFDFFLASIGLIIFLPIFIIVTIIGFFDTRSPFFIQRRVGKYKVPFNLIKFRTMAVGTASVASHMADRNSITKFGFFLRKYKIDELPQLINVLMGQMSLVGPRPNLFSQHLLIEHRDLLDVYSVLPGITGLAQVNKIDMSTPLKLAKCDERMISSLNLRSYFVYLFMTIAGSGSGDAVK